MEKGFLARKPASSFWVAACKIIQQIFNKPLWFQLYVLYGPPSLYYECLYFNNKIFNSGYEKSIQTILIVCQNLSWNSQNVLFL